MDSLGAALGLQISCLELRTSGGMYGLHVEGELRGVVTQKQEGRSMESLALSYRLVRAW